MSLHRYSLIPSSLKQFPTSLFQGISEDHLSGTSMDLLGPLLFFLDRNALAQLDREALKLRLEDLRQYCMPSDSFREMAALLTERRMLG